MTGKACFYSLLGASKSASPAEIRSAYRRKALATHPDKGGTAAEFAQVVVAFETLADPSRRAEYDEKFGKCVSKHKKCESKLPHKRPPQPEEKEPQAKKQRTSKKTSKAAKPWSFERPPQCKQRKSWRPEEFENFVHRFFGHPRTELKAEVARMTQDHLEAFLLFLSNNTLEPPTVEPTQPPEPAEPAEPAEPEFVHTSDTGHLFHGTSHGGVTDDEADLVEDAQFLAICDAWEDELEDLAEDTVASGKPCGNRRGTNSNARVKGIVKSWKSDRYVVVIGIDGLAIKSRFALDLHSAINVHISFIRFREMFREKVKNGVSHEAAFLQAKAVMLAEANAANTPIKMIFVLGGNKMIYDDQEALSEWRCRRFKLYMKNLQSLIQRQTKLGEGCRARELKKRWGVSSLPPGIQQASFQSENDSVYAELSLRDGTTYLVWVFKSKFSLGWRGCRSSKFIARLFFVSCFAKVCRSLPAKIVRGDEGSGDRQCLAGKQRGCGCRRGIKTTRFGSHDSYFHGIRSMTDTKVPCVKKGLARIFSGLRNPQAVSCFPKIQRHAVWVTVTVSAPSFLGLNCWTHVMVGNLATCACQSLGHKRGRWIR